MSFIRFTLDLAVKEPLPQALKDRLSNIRSAIRELKAYASRINEGAASEEMTVRAVYHRCHHDELSTPCEPEVEV